MRIAFLAAGDEWIASSRMRVHAIRRALDKQGILTCQSYAPGVDVLIIQKKLTEDILATATQALADGCLVVYDVDDLGDALWYWAPRPLFERCLGMADLVLTATPEQRDVVVREFGVHRLAVMPCPIDYFPDSPPPVAVRDQDELRILWFGNLFNFRLIQPYLAPLIEVPAVKPVIVTNSEAAEFLPQQYPSIEFVPWSLDSFTTVLCRADLVMCTHDGSEDDRAKSNNKMVTSIAWGVPAIASGTPDYERAAHELDVEEALFDGTSDFPSAIERMRPADVRRAYIKRAQPRAWARYAADSVARYLVDILRSAGAGRREI